MKRFTKYFSSSSSAVTLRPYQLHGVRWLTHCMKTLGGCILGDEMGLGKTCQVSNSDVFITVTLLFSIYRVVLFPVIETP